MHGARFSQIEPMDATMHLVAVTLTLVGLKVCEAMRGCFKPVAMRRRTYSVDLSVIQDLCVPIGTTTASAVWSVRFKSVNLASSLLQSEGCLSSTAPQLVKRGLIPKLTNYFLASSSSASPPRSGSSVLTVSVSPVPPFDLVTHW